jgi:hypothetical protein
MATVFSEFVFENLTGVESTVTLEAPIGSYVMKDKVPPSAKRVFTPDVVDARSALIVVNDGSHETKQKIDLTGSGSPNNTFIEAIETQYNVGSMNGRVKARY